MIRFLLSLLILLTPVLSLADFPGITLDPRIDYRYCGVPKRDANGDIVRSGAVLSAFQRLHPCPSTGLKVGACPGWSKNHTVPLACGGCDAVFNLQWLPDTIKTCSDPHCIDRFERRIYAIDPPVPGTGACSLTLTP